MRKWKLWLLLGSSSFLVFFLLLVKCRAAGRHLAELTGMDQRLLAGEGEMVVYYSPQR